MCTQNQQKKVRNVVSTMRQVRKKRRKYYFSLASKNSEDNNILFVTQFVSIGHDTLGSFSSLLLFFNHWKSILQLLVLCISMTESLQNKVGSSIRSGTFRLTESRKSGISIFISLQLPQKQSSFHLLHTSP